MRLFAAILFFLPLSVLAQAQVPNVFEDGTPATAAEVNENFDAIEAALPPSDCTIDQVIKWDAETSSWTCADYSGVVYLLETGEAVGAAMGGNSIWVRISGGGSAHAAIANGKFSNPSSAYFSDPDCRGDVASRFVPDRDLFNSQDGYQYVYAGEAPTDFTYRSHGKYTQSVYACTPVPDTVLTGAWPLAQAGGTPTWIVTGQSVSMGLK